MPLEWQPQGEALQSLIHRIGMVLLLGVWIAWWLAAVNWSNAWTVLAKGTWIPVVLLVIVSALVWSRIAPRDVPLLGDMVAPNLWWQLVATSLLAGLALFCGWLQGVLGCCTPAEIEVNPVETADHDHQDHHGHGPAVTPAAAGHGGAHL